MLALSDGASSNFETPFKRLGGVRRLGRGDGAVGGLSAVLSHLWGSGFNGR